MAMLKMSLHVVVVIYYLCGKHQNLNSNVSAMDASAPIFVYPDPIHNFNKIRPIKFLFKNMVFVAVFLLAPRDLH